MDNLETVWKVAISVNNAVKKKICISTLCVDPPRLFLLDLLHEFISVEDLRELLTTVEAQGWGGEVQLLAVGHWMDASKIDHVEQLEDLLTFINFGAFSSDEVANMLSSGFAMVEGK